MREVIDATNNFIAQLFGRADSKIYARLLIQPVVAVLLAVRAGIRDANKAKKQNPEEVPERRHSLRLGFADFDVVFYFAVAVDCVCQIVFFRRVYFLQAILVALVLAILPYFLIRDSVACAIKKVVL